MGTPNFQELTAAEEQDVEHSFLSTAMAVTASTKNVSVPQYIYVWSYLLSTPPSLLDGTGG